MILESVISLLIPIFLGNFLDNILSIKNLFYTGLWTWLNIIKYIIYYFTQSYGLNSNREAKIVLYNKNINI